MPAAGPVLGVSAVRSVGVRARPTFTTSGPCPDERDDDLLGVAARIHIAVNERRWKNPPVRHAARRPPYHVSKWTRGFNSGNSRASSVGATSPCTNGSSVR
jgi:hypothetical protein